MTLPSTPRSLRTELLFTLAPLLAIGVALPVTLAALLPSGHGVLLTVVIVVDVVLCLMGGAYALRRVVMQPLHELARAAEEITTRELTQRMPQAPVCELQTVASIFDRLTSRIDADRAHLVRAEKLASIGRLAASVAHEIGNPLGAMLGHVHVLRKQLLRRAAPAEDLELLAALERESTRIERIVRGLLDYARVQPPQLAAVDIELVIRSTVDLLATQGALRGVKVTLELTNAPLHVGGQPHDLEQLLLNLLINGIDAMNGRGEIVIRVERAARVSLREPATRRTIAPSDAAVEHPPSSRAQRWLKGNDAAEIAKIVVADSGPGVPAALVERIFDPFYTTKPAGKGTGLGLAIVARIVENCQGTIWVTTAREGGAAFHLLLPVVAAPSAAATPARPGPCRPTPPISRSRVAAR